LPSTTQPLDRLRIERETGQTAAEYTVVLGVITLAIVTTLGLMSGAIQGILDGVAGLFS